MSSQHKESEGFQFEHKHIFFLVQKHVPVILYIHIRRESHSPVCPYAKQVALVR